MISATSCSKASASVVPVLLNDVARIELGPDERRGIAEMDGTGEVVAASRSARRRPMR